MTDLAYYNNHANATRKMRNPELWVGKTIPADLDYSAFDYTYNFCDNCQCWHKFDDLHNPIYPTNAYAWWMQKQLGIEEAQGFCEDCYYELTSKAESIDPDWYGKVLDGGDIPADNTPATDATISPKFSTEYTPPGSGFAFTLEMWTDSYFAVVYGDTERHASSAAGARAAATVWSEELQKEQDMSPDDPTPSAPAQRGQRIKITDSPFTGWQGIYLRKDEHPKRSKVLLFPDDPGARVIAFVWDDDVQVIDTPDDPQPPTTPAAVIPHQESIMEQHECIRCREMHSGDHDECDDCRRDLTGKFIHRDGKLYRQYYRTIQPGTERRVHVWEFKADNYDWHPVRNITMCFELDAEADTPAVLPVREDVSTSACESKAAKLTKRPLTDNQRALLEKVIRADLRNGWYLDRNSAERRALMRLEMRGLVEPTGEGEDRWRMYWQPTEAGLRLCHVKLSTLKPGGTTHAASAPRGEHVVRTKARQYEGEYYPAAMTREEITARYEFKYGCKPAVYVDCPELGKVWAGIEAIRASAA